MFNRLNAQQQPFIQSGYGAMGRLNTLLGLGGRRGSQAPFSANPAYRPTPGGGVQPILQVGGTKQIPRPVGSSPKANPRLNQLLALRAANGDTEAERMLGMM